MTVLDFIEETCLTLSKNENSEEQKIEKFIASFEKISILLC